MNEDAITHHVKMHSAFSGRSMSFDPGIAEYFNNTDVAIIFNHIMFWLRQNRSRGSNFIDGRTWMYETIDNIASYFGFYTERQVRFALNKLVDEGFLLRSNHNKNVFDKTSWYAVYDESLLEIKKSSTKRQNCPIDESKNVCEATKLSLPQDKIVTSYNVSDITPDKETATQLVVVSSFEEECKEQAIQMLNEIDLPKKEKNTLLRKYRPSRIILAIEYSKKAEIKTTLIQTLQWHCSEEFPPIAKVSKEQIAKQESLKKITKHEENSKFTRDLMDRMELQEHEEVIRVLDDRIELIMVNGSRHPMGYTEENFQEILMKHLEHYGLLNK